MDADRPTPCQTLQPLLDETGRWNPPRATDYRMKIELFRELLTVAPQDIVGPVERLLGYYEAMQVEVQQVMARERLPGPSEVDDTPFIRDLPKVVHWVNELCAEDWSPPASVPDGVL